ncbi:ferritin-like domain-containing protein [Flavobacterium sp.]|uniref:YciE/YciF ferroxidase family protein n=1 Tax=Flavobacterium sp. TaxID=239 RepID=UPI0026394A86|nr:ferritin-like domain-containing protein [Flavobacterium sp.]
MDHSKSNTGGNQKSNSSKSSSAEGSQKGTANRGMKSSQLLELFEDELKDIYWAEKALTKALPKLIKNATSTELVDALTAHLTETEEQVSRVEQVFELLGKKAVAKKCEAMSGLLQEGEEIMEECEAGAMRDAGIISAGQKVEHYEIATYGTLRQFAETLGLTAAAKLLQTTLDEEKAADEKLTQIAVTAVNIEAAESEA